MARTKPSAIASLVIEVPCAANLVKAVPGPPAEAAARLLLPVLIELCATIHDPVGLLLLLPPLLLEKADASTAPVSRPRNWSMDMLPIKLAGILLPSGAPVRRISGIGDRLSLARYAGLQT
jgi:hypothetical protein